MRSGAYYLIECPKCHLIQYWAKSDPHHADSFNCIHCNLSFSVLGNVVQNVNRTPKLGWNELTIIEAMLDSAMHMQGNKRDEKLNKTLGYVRELIKIKKKGATLLNVCEFRETQRTRCNRYPAFLQTNNEYRCDKHKL